MKIFVENLAVVGYHGYYEEERRDGRRFIFDLEVDVPDPGDGDDLEETVDYRELSEIIMRHVDGESVKLIETLGERIIRDVLNEHASVESVELQIRKYATGVPGDPEHVGIRMQRTRN